MKIFDRCKLVVALIVAFCSLVGVACAETLTRYQFGDLSFELPEILSNIEKDEYAHYYYDVPEGFDSNVMAFCAYDEFEYDPDDFVDVVESFMDSFMGSDVETLWVMIENSVASKANHVKDSVFYLNTIIVPDDNGLYSFVVMSKADGDHSINDDIFNTAVESMRYGVSLTPEWLVSEFSNLGIEKYTSTAEYVENGNYFLFSLRDTQISSAIWNTYSVSVRKQLTDAFASISDQIKEALDGIGCTDTVLICTYQLVDGSVASMLINGADHTEYVS